MPLNVFIWNYLGENMMVFTEHGRCSVITRNIQERDAGDHYLEPELPANGLRSQPTYILMNGMKHDGALGKGDRERNERDTER